MSLYDIDYKRLATLLLPMRLRSGTLNAMLSSVSRPLGELRQELVSYRADKDYRLGHNGQVCYLRALINDKLDAELRRIIIAEPDNSESSIIMLHKRATLLYRRIPQRVTSSTLRIFRRGLSGAGQIGFWVKVPHELRGSINEQVIHALVSNYKLASVRYGITYYDNTSSNS